MMKAMMRESYRILFILLLFATIFVLGRCSCDGIIDSQPRIRVDTLYQERIDTIHLTHEITKYRPIPTRSDTIYIVKNNDVVSNITNVYEGNDSVIIRQDSLLPQRLDYHWYVRNVNNDLDSLGITINGKLPVITKQVEINKEITKYKQKRLTHGLQIGIGYGLMNHIVDAYIGYGFQYNF